MASTNSKRTHTLALVISAFALAAAAPALADKPSWAGKGKGGEQHQKGKSQRDGGNSAKKEHPRFDDRQTGAAREYYVEESRGGKCPPGLAKKRNGCLPPGQAKKWQVNRPLPRDVIYYEVPARLVVQIGAPPPGYRYVRVATDILMIAIGTGMVVDAIQDLIR